MTSYPCCASTGTFPGRWQRSKASSRTCGTASSTPEIAMGCSACTAFIAAAPLQQCPASCPSGKLNARLASARLSCRPRRGGTPKFHCQGWWCSQQLCALADTSRSTATAAQHARAWKDGLCAQERPAEMTTAVHQNRSADPDRRSMQTTLRRIRRLHRLALLKIALPIFLEPARLRTRVGGFQCTTYYSVPHKHEQLERARHGWIAGSRDYGCWDRMASGALCACGVAFAREPQPLPCCAADTRSYRPSASRCTKFT